MSGRASVSRSVDDGLGGGGHGPLRPHDRGGGDQELGHVGGQPEIGGGHLRPAQPDDGRGPVGADEHLVGAQPAMGDAAGVEAGDLEPRPSWSKRVGDLVLGQVGEGPALDELEGEQAVVVRRLADGHHPGDGGAGAGRQVGGQGLVAHLRARADIGELVLDPLDPQHPPGPVEQVGVPLVATDEGHVDRRPIRPPAHEHRAAVGGQRLQRVDLQAGPGQGVDQARRIEASGRRPEGGEHGGAHDHADEHGDRGH